VLIEGANHYSFCAGYDGTSGRGYLEAPASRDGEALRSEILAAVLDFCVKETKV
jgi:hypothetical protein